MKVLKIFIKIFFCLTVSYGVYTEVGIYTALFVLYMLAFIEAIPYIYNKKIESLEMFVSVLNKYKENKKWELDRIGGAVVDK